MSIRGIFLVAAFAGCSMQLACAQTPPRDTRNQDQLIALIKEVRDQQTELAANQTKLDEKLAALTEAIRQARIYSSRAGR